MTDESDTEIRRVVENLKNADSDWEYLSGGERHGTILQAINDLEDVI